jgi:hypothetical protein
MSFILEIGSNGGSPAVIILTKKLSFFIVMIKHIPGRNLDLGIAEVQKL